MCFWCMHLCDYYVVWGAKVINFKQNFSLLFSYVYNKDLSLYWSSGTPLQYSSLENPMDRGAWWAAVHGVTEGRTQLSDFTFTFHFHFSLSCIGEVNGNPLQCSCLENPGDGGAWWAAVSGVAQSRTRLKRLSSSIMKYTSDSSTFISANSLNKFIFFSGM